jgi:hypothetical protein
VLWSKNFGPLNKRKRNKTKGEQNEKNQIASANLQEILTTEAVVKARIGQKLHLCCCNKKNT